MFINKKYRYIRLVLYIVLIIFLLLFKYKNIINYECIINKNFNLLCPTCGMTRATKELLNFNLMGAMENHLFYIIVMLPFVSIIIIDDIYCIIKGLFKKKEKISFLEIIFGG